MTMAMYIANWFEDSQSDGSDMLQFQMKGFGTQTAYEKLSL